VSHTCAGPRNGSSFPVVVPFNAAIDCMHMPNAFLAPMVVLAYKARTRVLEVGW
jgi:hypothetical protein